METLSTIISKSIALTVIHSLWQGAAIAGVTAILIFLVAKKSAKLKYTIYCTALVVFLISTVFTFHKLQQQLRSSAKTESFVTINKPTTQINPFLLNTKDEPLQLSSFATLKAYMLKHLGTIALLWFIGLSISFIRLLRSINQVKVLKRNLNFLPTNYWQDKLNTMASQIGVAKAIQLVESKFTLSPIVIGHLKPIILFPIGFINRLSVEEVEAILAHELAHIKRNDYLLNILITVTQSLFYYHPAIWWLNAQIKKERENCCDDMAVELCGDKLAYAKSLVNAQTFLANSQVLAMGVNGQGFKSNLGQRIARLLSPKSNTSTTTEKYIGLSFIGALLISVGVMAQISKSNIQQKKYQANEHPNKVTPPEDSTAKQNKDYNGSFDYTETQTGDRIKYEVVNGTITKLSVNGKLLSSSEYKNYEPKINALINNHQKMTKSMEQMRLAEIDMAKSEALMRESEKQMRLSELSMLESEKQMRVNEEKMRLSELDMIETEKQMNKQEKLMQLQELEMKRQEKLMQQQEVEMKKQEVRMKKFKNETNNVLAAWELVLIKEKLWTSTSNRFKITNQSAFINGKIIPKEIHLQLLDIYKAKTGSALKDGYAFDLTGSQVNKPDRLNFRTQ